MRILVRVGFKRFGNTSNTSARTKAALDKSVIINSFNSVPLFVRMYKTEVELSCDQATVSLPGAGCSVRYDT